MLESNSTPVLTDRVIFSLFFNLTVPYFPHLQNGHSAYLVVFFAKSKSDDTRIRCLKQCLAPSDHPTEGVITFMLYIRIVASKKVEMSLKNILSVAKVFKFKAP